MSRKPLDYSLNLDIGTSKRKTSLDLWIILSVLFLSVFGIFMIYSASQSLEMAFRQGIYLVLGFSLLLLISFSNFRKMELFYLYSYWPGLFFLILVLIIPSEGNETKRWIDFGLFTFQPSELMRFLIPVSAAAFLSRKPMISNFDYLTVFLCYFIVILL